MKEENKHYLDFEPQPADRHTVNGRDINRCIGCGIQDKRVECGGIYHCPNPLCRACGAWHVREAFGFHQEATKDADGILPTEEFEALRGWAKRMIDAAVEQALETERNKTDLNIGRS